MRRALVVLATLSFVGAAHADTFVGAGGPATFVIIPTPAATTAPATPSGPQTSMADLQSLWTGAGAAYGIPWQVLAAINKIESNFGRNMGPSSAGAIGWMQFMPSTWARWGIDANGDGVADPWNAADAIYSAARYLAAAGGTANLGRAIFAYNHAGWYVNDVLSLASLYEGGGTGIVSTFEQMQQRLSAARGQLADVNAKLGSAAERARALARTEKGLLARAHASPLLSDTLALQKRAVQVGVLRVAAYARVAGLRQELAAARGKVDTLTASTNAATFEPAGAQLLAAPLYSGNYVFPVGGGPGLVSVGHTHHDYPAADIAAPEGSPVYALADAVVVQTWALPQGNCGIGVKLTTSDGQTWTYCHLSYLGANVRPGVQLAAGSPVGLVGATGDATGPHLHLQLDPPNAYPQDEAWFAGFGGTAFRWQDDGGARTLLSAAATGPVSTSFVGPTVEFSRDVVYFTR